ncbi:beta-N-acetylhexosaminidase [Anaerotaenia torta]|uniref:glycoside hydrolase family 3 protein n=1 Tax=Anaerotaenia torta TaxID=433293 RepID=UPI003D2394F2
MERSDLRRLVGQRMVAGFGDTEINEDIKDLIINYKIGNIILFKHNIINNEQLKKLCGDLQDLIQQHTGQEAFIAVDQEGGMITRLGQDAANMPGAMAIAATGKVENAFLSGKITGEQLSSVGVNFDLAPTVDVNSNMHNPVIGVRSYSDRPEEAARYAVAMTKGLLEGGVYACAKHFPGHGDTNVDSHVGLPLIDKDINELEECELIPFRRVIEAGIPAVMTTHILFPKMEEGNVPATMSHKIITGLLKEKLGFKGLVVSDCMQMSAIKKYYGTAEGSLQAIKAGVDLVFISHTASIVREVSDKLTEALETGELSVRDMENAVKKIIGCKEELRKKKRAHGFDAEKGRETAFELLKQSITPVNFPAEGFSAGNQPVFIGAPAFRASNVSNEQEAAQFADYMEENMGGTGIRISPDPGKEEIAEVIKRVKKEKAVTGIVIGTYNGHLYTGQMELVRALADHYSNILVIALRNPYDLRELPKGVYGIAAYEYTHKSLRAITELLQKQFVPNGVLPVKMG